MRYRGYGNEEAVGEGIRRAGVPRDQLFVTSKLWSTHHSKVEEALDESLKKLGLEYLDCTFSLMLPNATSISD